jgi:aldehyde dehydrogenase (NAD+)
MIVLPDADLDMASEAAVFGAYFHQGQICMGLNRIVVVGDRHGEFGEIMKTKVGKLKAGDPADPEVFVGPLISRGQVAKFEKVLDESLKAGARALVEGKTEGNVVHPWLLADVTNDMPIARNEVFGPVCSIMRAGTEEEAVQIVNDTEYGLSNSVMGRDRCHALEIASRLESGMVHVNDQTIGEEFHVMFGAEKQSGVGRFNGKWVLEKFTTEQWISVK